MAHQFGCSQCAFMIRSEDENEVVRLVRDHAENTHGISVSRDDVQNGMEEAAAD